MPYFIRKKNHVYRSNDIVRGPEWSEITPTTKSIVAAVFTTRQDASDIIAKINDPVAKIYNNLDFFHE